jgi:hypothetical protein
LVLLSSCRQASVEGDVEGVESGLLPVARPLPPAAGGIEAHERDVAGAQTDACIRSTLHGAFTRGYDATLVSDAHTTEDQTSWGAPPPEAVIAHTNLYWTYQTAPGRKAGTIETKDVDFNGAS